MMEVELWRDVPDIPYYQASTHGRIRTKWSKPKNQWTPSILTQEWRVVPPLVASDGYLQVHLPASLTPDGKKRRVDTHILVCKAFYGLPKPDQEVRHFPDGTKTNNYVSNLLWGTRVENISDRVLQGGHNKGKEHWAVKLSEEAVREIRSIKWTRSTARILADKYGVTSKYVRAVRGGFSWKWLA